LKKHSPNQLAAVSLDLSQLRALEADPSQLDGVPVIDGALPPHFILTAAIEALAHGKPPLWFSIFAFRQAQPLLIVGTGGFRGAPVNGRVEVGYGVAEPVRGRGIATSAVRQLTALAFAEPDVSAVFAETAVDNVPSRRVVEKNGFLHIGQRETTEDGVVDRWLLSRAVATIEPAIVGGAVDHAKGLARARTAPRAAAIIIENSKVLLDHRFNGDREYWVLPGGSVEAGESPEQACRREAKEETGLEIHIERTVLAFSNDGREESYCLAWPTGGKLELGEPERSRQSPSNRYMLEWTGAVAFRECTFQPGRLKQTIVDLLAANGA
jgi:RimJ/RimL family protein N-acetyltransferase/ADP-ribose pyrophosphatase YjhB (NUDIX family)